MANLLSNIDIWTSIGVPPSGFWNGSAYVFDNVSTHFDLSGYTTQDGDYISIGATVSAANKSGVIRVTVDGVALNDIHGSSQFNCTSTSAQYDRWDIPAGTTALDVFFDATPDSGSVFTVTPQDAPAPSAVNGSMTVQLGSPSEQAPCQLTLNGSPVVADSFSIVMPPVYGSCVVSGNVVSYSPGSSHIGSDSFTYTGSYQGETSNVATVSITVTPLPKCDELGRTTRVYVSAYTRERVHTSRLIIGEKRCLLADFNGAIGSARKIVKARWRTDFGYICIPSNPSIAADQRSTQIQLAANWIGDMMIHLEATLDNGEVYTQMFYVQVSGNPWFLPSYTVYGPSELVVTA